MEKENEVETFYDNVSKKYNEYEDRVCDRILEHFMLVNLPKHKKLRILDAGGGIGRFSRPLLEKGHEVVLSDISKGMLEKAKQMLKQYKNISFIKESATDMKNQADESFDVVLAMNEVLDYCGNHDQAIREAFRVLKKGGIFIGNVNNRFVYCKNHELKDEKYKLFEKNMETGDRYVVWGGLEKGHISHEFTLDELKKSLTRGKFKIIKIIGVFNLLKKSEQEKIKNKKEFIKLQIKYAEIPEYINNSSEFLFIAQKISSYP